jgi:large subunit ribosomal protein L14
MIISETTLKVLDNSGALTAKCFRIYGRNVGNLGSLIVVSIQSFRTGKKVKKGEVYKGIVISTKNFHRRSVGNYIKSLNNGVVLWKRKEDSPVGTRVLAHIPNELRFMGYLKLILIAIGTF